MALTYTARGTGSHNTAATSFTVTPASNFAAGMAVLIIASDNSASGGAQFGTWTVTDDKGNTWIKRQNALIDPGAANAGQAGAIFTTDQANGLLTAIGTTITVSFGSDTPTAKTWNLKEVTGSVGTPTYVTGGTGTGGTGTTSPTITTGTIPVADMTVGALFLEAGTTEVITADADATNGSWSTQQAAQVGSTTSGSCCASQTKVQTTTGSTQTYNPTLSILGDLCLAWIQITEVTTAIKTVLGLAKSSVKTVSGLAIANVKTIEGLA